MFALLAKEKNKRIVFFFLFSLSVAHMPMSIGSDCPAHQSPSTYIYRSPTPRYCAASSTGNRLLCPESSYGGDRGDATLDALGHEASPNSTAAADSLCGERLLLSRCSWPGSSQTRSLAFFLCRTMSHPEQAKRTTSTRAAATAIPAVAALLSFPEARDADGDTEMDDTEDAQVDAIVAPVMAPTLVAIEVASVPV